MVRRSQVVVLTVQYFYGKCRNGGLNLLMDILQYTPDILSSLTLFYNQLTTDVPLCYPIKEEELEIALCGVTTGKANKQEGGLDSEAAYVAISKDTVNAFIHVGIGQIGDNREVDIGVIRFLGYERGARHAGQTVLEKAEEYFKACNVSQIWAFSQDCKYRCYHFEHAYLSDALDHVQALLGYNGYHRSAGEVFLVWENYTVTPTPTDIPVTFSVKWKEGRGKRPNCSVKAYYNDKKVGECDSVSGGEFSSHPEAQDWLHTVWLGIEGEFQGQGIGKYLLQHTLHEMQNVGYRHAAISTNWENYRAFLFYSNCGYKVDDWTYELKRN